jgi:hypothetical protein
MISVGMNREASLKCAADAVRCHKQVRYGPAARNLLDVYVPKPSSRSPIIRASNNRGLPIGTQAIESQPVVLFVHGGVWSSGERWQYCLLGDTLASAGIIACVMSYTLYPDALVGTMVWPNMHGCDMLQHTSVRQLRCGDLSVTLCSRPLPHPQPLNLEAVRFAAHQDTSAAERKSLAIGAHSPAIIAVAVRHGHFRSSRLVKILVQKMSGMYI